MKCIRTWLMLLACIILLGCSKDDSPTTSYGSLEGKITEQQTNKPISNALMVLTPADKKSTTDNNGNYKFQSLEAGKYTLKVEVDGYSSITRQITITPNETTKCDIQLSPITSKTIKLSPAELNFGDEITELTVTITNEASSVANWSVILGDNNWLTASPQSGNLDANKSATINFIVDRELISEETDATIYIDAFNKKHPISITCLPTPPRGELIIAPTSINFGDTTIEQILELKNVGTGNVEWYISDIADETISTYANEGIIEPDGIMNLRVWLDRDKLVEDLSSTITISDQNGDYTIEVSAQLNSAGANINNKICYTSKYDDIITPTEKDAFGASIVFNTYENGIGVITINGEVTQIGNRAFNNRYELTSIIIPEGVETIGLMAFNGCTSLASIDIPSSVKSIESNAFSSCEALSSITLPEGITTINIGTFAYCKGLKNITIPESVTTIKNTAFSYCSNLESIYLPSNLEVIELNTFNNCTSLKSVTIPTGVTSIGDKTFSGCSSLDKVYCKPTTPPALGEGSFSGNDNITIYVPIESVNIYKEANGWKGYADKIAGGDF